MFIHQRAARLITILLVAGLLCACKSSTTDEGPSPPKTPSEEKNTFVLEPGLEIQLVASEPMVQDPVVLTFDENNRLWVVEMRGFMPDIDGNGEKDKIGRISILEDKDGDGLMDASTVYLDSLIMPRALAIVKGGALVVENQALWMTEDLDHDLKADRKTLIDKDYAGSALPEHSGNGLLRGIDNWYYNAKSRFRYKFKEGAWKRDSTEFRGQWGISQDDEGRLYYNYNWSQLHADLVPPNYIGRNKHHTPTIGIDYGLTIDRHVYPIRDNPAVNRGYIPGTLDSAGRLLEFTAACSPYYYRGNEFPKEYEDNVFVCEPSGNLVKRNIVVHDGVYVKAHDPHPGKEFLASTDERFRPVYITSGPDGNIYLADMYRGLVQHGAYVTPYLRDQTITRKLVAPVHQGRIWRIVPTPSKKIPTPKLSVASDEELISYLGNENGWYRDLAQRLLVEKNDASINASLVKVIASSSNRLQRLHALWTLEGKEALETSLLLSLLNDTEELIRINALRLLEPYAQSDEKVKREFSTRIDNMPVGSVRQSLQVALSVAILPAPRKLSILQHTIQQYDTSALIRDAVMSSLHDHEFDFLKLLAGSEQWKSPTPSKEIFIETLAAAVARKRDPRELGALLARLDPRRGRIGWQEKTILTGLSIQATGKANPVMLTSVPAIFASKTPGSDSLRIYTLESMFEWPGHKATRRKPDTRYSLTETDQKQFAVGRQHYLTTCAGCHGSDGNGLSRFAPPLAGSEWVTGNQKRLALIVLHGLEGAVDVSGKKYDAPDILPVMPSHSTMDDGAITAVMTYIRNEWGNHSPSVNPRVVSKTRHTTQGRVQPWTAKELNEFVDKNPQVLDLK